MRGQFDILFSVVLFISIWSKNTLQQDAIFKAGGGTEQIELFLFVGKQRSKQPLIASH